MQRELDEANKGDLFEEMGLTVAHGEVEVGKTYPIFGMITELCENDSGQVIAKINYNITARIFVSDTSKVNLLKERAFDSGIFISTVVSKEPEIVVECKTVIFGRPQHFNA